MPWAEEYRPTSLSSIVGNRDARKDFLSWANSWKTHQEAAVLHGVPGIGKTTAAHALAEDKDWEVMEMNASNKRTGSIIDRIAGEASRTASLFGAEQKLIILDEADNLHGNVDRGGKSAMTRVIKNAEQPIVLIANDYYEMSRSLRNASQEIELDPLDVSDVVDALKRICNKRDIDASQKGLRSIARSADGDVRAAVNDLQKNATDGTLKADEVSVESRDRKEEIFPFLDAVFKEETPQTVQEDARDLDMTPNDLYRWLDNNVSREYDGAELTRGYDALARANKWLSRTIRTQEYKYWRYANDQLTAGVASARRSRHGGWTRWQFPRYSSSSKHKQEVARKVAETAGTSMRIARKEVVPMLASMTHHCKPRDLTVTTAAEYDFDTNEVSALTGSGKTTNKVQSIVKDAQNQRQEFDIGSNSDKTKIQSQSQDAQDNPQKEETEQTAQSATNQSLDDVVQREEIESLAGVGSAKADRLIDGGFTTLQSIRSATDDELTEISGIGPQLSEQLRSEQSGSETSDDQSDDSEQDSSEEEKTDTAGLGDFL